MTPLILKRSKVSRPSGQWSDDDYDVICQGAVVGQVFLSPGAPADKPWMWTLANGYREDRTPTHGYEATREAAMAVFAKNKATLASAATQQTTLEAPSLSHRICTPSPRSISAAPLACVANPSGSHPGRESPESKSYRERTRL